ncbi:hypothetical protein [Brevundimonas sp. SL130]|uniref:hypothetical protein n=1 Tax=Brevundimonas sp. SL130 TaxID=2995143 RepID=UPI00226CDA42|nr:hypothetical protein [Brevundimonas sp. SL130]WAC59622.1 hypothetical protein OU998_15610 [Brevundimonas sp. SL130]
MNDKTEFANLIARRLQTAEQAVDQALAEISLLTHDMTRHRAGARFAAQAGHQALIDAHAAASALVEGRSRLVASHDRLARTARVLGIAITAGGPLEGKEQPAARAAAQVLED